MKEFIESFTGHVPSYVWNLIVITIAIIIGLCVKVFIKLLLKFYGNRSANKNYSLLHSIITHLSTPLTYFAPLLLIGIMLPLLIIDKGYYAFLARVVGILMVISFAGLLINSLSIFEDYVYHTYDLNKTDNLKERKIRTQLQFIRKLLITLIIFITIAIILLSFESVRKIGAGLLTGVGIGGIIIGIAAQKSLSNLLAGFQIAFTQPIRIDDVLFVENEYGRVEDITLTYVVVNLWDQRRLILPITYFIEKPFQNWTRISSELLRTVFLYMDYSLPIDSLREEFDRLLEKTELWDKRVKIIQVTDATANTIQVRVLVSVRNSSQGFDLCCYLRENLIKFVQDNYPQCLPVQRVMLNDRLTKEKPAGT